MAIKTAKASLKFNKQAFMKSMIEARQVEITLAEHEMVEFQHLNDKDEPIWSPGSVIDQSKDGRFVSIETEGGAVRVAHRRTVRRKEG